MTPEIASRDISTQEFGIGYQVSDSLSVGASMTSSKDDVSQHETDVTSFSGQYTIAPGLSATAALNNYEVVDNYWNRANDGTTIVLTVQANF